MCSTQCSAQLVETEAAFIEAHHIGMDLKCRQGGGGEWVTLPIRWPPLRTRRECFSFHGAIKRPSQYGLLVEVQACAA